MLYCKYGNNGESQKGITTMEATFKNRDIKAIIDGTVWEHEPYTEGEQTANMAVLGYYAPSGANWFYTVGVTLSDEDIKAINEEGEA